MKKILLVFLIATSASFANAQTAEKSVAVPDASILHSRDTQSMSKEQGDAILAQLQFLNNTETEILQQLLIQNARK